MTDLHEMDVVLTGALEASGSRKAGGAAGFRHGFSFAVMAVFFLVMMLCLVAGVSIYRAVSAQQDDANRLRMSSGFITNLVRMGDMADAVQRGEGPEGDMLVLVNVLPSGTYETRFYLYKGHVVEEYAIAGRPANPEDAVQVVESSVFTFEFDGDLLTFTTDDGTFAVTLRSHHEVPTGGGA